MPRLSPNRSYFCSMSEGFINYLERFQPIPAADRDLLCDTFQERFVPEGQLLHMPGKVCRELYFISSGVLRILSQNDNGQEVTHNFLKENQCCTILRSFNEQVPADESIMAACDATVLIMPKQVLTEVYKKLPYLQEILNQTITQVLLDKVNTRNSSLGLDAAARYQQFIERQHDIATRVSLNDIASYLGITPQSLSRIRKNIR